jgi:drug/metabolite transporter (DMT)-like permease
MKLALAAIRGCVPEASVTAASAFYMGWRFAFAALLYFAVTFRTQRGFTRADMAGGLSVGGTFALGIFFQLVGLNYTRPSISGFLTSLVVVFTPVAQAVWLRRPPTRTTWAAVALALSGGVILGLSGDSGQALRTAPFPFCGEALTVAGSLCFTGQILFLDHYGRRADTARLTFIMFAATAALPLAAGLFMPGGAAVYRTEALAALCGDWTVHWTFWTTIVFSSVFAFHLMNKHQPRLTPAMAGVIYCTEPVFATLFSILIGTEVWHGRLFIGGGLILSGLLLVALGARSVRRND